MSKNLHLFNLALLAKNSMKLFSKPNSPFTKLFRDKYFPNNTPNYIKEKQQTSWAWKGIREGLRIVNKNIHWKLNSGNNSNIWEDNWLPLGKVEFLKRLTNLPTPTITPFLNHDYSWNIGLQNKIFPPDIVKLISQQNITPIRGYPFDMEASQPPKIFTDYFSKKTLIHQTPQKILVFWTKTSRIKFGNFPYHRKLELSFGSSFLIGYPPKIILLRTYKKHRLMRIVIFVTIVVKLLAIFSSTVLPYDKSGRTLSCIKT